MIPDKAFILAAGLGTRMRPLTDERPKPLVQVAGRSLIDHALDHLIEAGISDVTINLHYMAEMLQQHLQHRASPQMHFSMEKELLDTGGGIKKTLEHFGGEAFYVLSGDALWSNGPAGNALERLSQAWDPARMDILVLLRDINAMKLTSGIGDYHLEEDGRAVRSYERQGRYMFTSIRINAPGIFDMSPDGAFSYLDLMDAAQKKGRLFGLVHDGDWHHISTPDDLRAVNEDFGQQKKSA